MRLLSKVWRALIFRDFSTWSPAHGALYNQILGRRKIVGFEWEVSQECPKDIFKGLSQKFIYYGVGTDGDFVEIRLGLLTHNPKEFVRNFFQAYQVMYANGVFPTGYHVSYNYPSYSRILQDGRISVTSRRVKERHYARYHYKLYGYIPSMLVSPAKSLRISEYPILLQFKPVMAAITPQQVLMDLILRNQMVYGMQSGTLKERKIEDMAAVMLQSTPPSLLKLFNYRTGCVMRSLVVKELQRHTLT